MSPGGVMKWLTGQSHRSFCGSDVAISLRFNHTCTEDNPNHKVCYPRVHACSREVILPCKHMKTFEEFKSNFLMAFCKGQAFGMQ